MSAITNKVIALAAGMTLVGAVSASAQPRGVVVVPRAAIVRPFVYDPFWGPWYGFGYPYAYPYDVRPETDIKTHVTPKDAEVYVDGFYAGRAQDFDGIFKKLQVAPGGHAITLYLDGYRTTTQEVYVSPDSTFKLNATMEALPVGQTSAPVPSSPGWRRGYGGQVRSQG